VFHDGFFLRGSTDIFGELGHTVYDEEGEICKCGNRGCLETIAGAEAIVRRCRTTWTGPTSARGRGAGITLEDVIHNAQEGNKLALLAVNEGGQGRGQHPGHRGQRAGHHAHRICTAGWCWPGELLRQQLLTASASTASTR